MAATNKCLAWRNKTRRVIRATKGHETVLIQSIEDGENAQPRALIGL
jgi:hypothetical protein